jgi:hypothetical protein
MSSSALGAKPPNFCDHITFGCRYGLTDDGHPGATMVDAASVAPDSAVFGQKLSRGQGLAHRNVAEFWTVTDFLLEHDPVLVHHHQH